MFELLKETMPLYMASASTIISLSTGALVLTVGFQEKLFGGKQLQLTVLLLCSWIFFLIAIGAGTLYQYLAVKAIEYAGAELLHQRGYSGTMDKPYHGLFHEYLRKTPGVVYFAMSIAFLGGIVCFVWEAIRRLRRHT